MPTTLKEFQETVCAGIVARLENVRALHDSLRNATPAQRETARRNDAAVVLQAPTGAGKTLIAVEAMRRVSREERVLWLWFAPFAGLVEQSRRVLAAHAPELTLFDLDSDRRVDTVRDGGVFVTTWAALAARNADSRRARTRGDAGLALDAVLALAREDGVRIGCVIDEAHHTAQTGKQAQAFFRDVLAPDYALLMTATPRDRDVAEFQRATGYNLSTPEDWASVSRTDAVEARLLKRGVRLVRFLARDEDGAQLVDFERLALRECAAMHRQIKTALREAGVALTPLMLVQVPDGKAAQQEAVRYLTEHLKFDAEAVRVHTADEPDPDLLSLAQDPTVEVLVFKMAVALGFDAPRAFTLTALRGVRDPGFAVQVIGRIVRRHALLQDIVALPPLLDHGYVFLANAQAQEGLLDAGALINALTTQAPELGTQTVMTMIGDSAEVQVVRSGEPLRLLLTPDAAQVAAVDGIDAAPASSDGTGVPQPDVFDASDTTAWRVLAQELLQLRDGAGERPAASTTPTPTGGVIAPLLALTQSAQYRYPLREDVPRSLRSERLPPPAPDYEAQLAAHVDFSDAVLGSRLRNREALRRSERDLFDGVRSDESLEDFWATVEPAAVAARAEQIRLHLKDANDRELHERLLARFADAIVRSGAEVPEDEEILMQQLDLVQVRHPALLQQAFRRLRLQQVVEVDAPLPGVLESDVRLEPARRGSYGVFPTDLNADETAVARMLDAHPQVLWWHRNPPRRAESVGLYRWNAGDGFYPDFVVAVNERKTMHRIALLEVKGDHLWGKPSEVEKAGAVHPDYGAVFTVGRKRGEAQFFHVRPLDGRLQTDGVLDVGRLRFV